MRKTLLSGMLALLLLLCAQGAGADPDLTLQDTSVRPGPWTQAYRQILQERSGRIRAYRDYVAEVADLTDCRPVELRDLTGDGTPELLFLELEEETEYGFRVGRLWIYTGDGGDVRCMLTLQPEIDDLLYSGFYLGKNGQLTLYFNDGEMGWKVQLRPDRTGVYEVRTVLTEQEDFSGEGPDSYYQNGKKISRKAYESAVRQMKAAQGVRIGSLDAENGDKGFTLTEEEALRELSAAGGTGSTKNAGESGGTAKGSPSDGQLPALVFTRGTFTPGEKFAVYSAPSTRSWRGAKGKAAITSGSEIFTAGMTDGWILIRYELESGLNRVGYINADKIRGDYSDVGALTLARTERTLAAAAEITDDPVHGATVIGKLKKGTKVICLAEYEGWIYAEAKVSGKTARGFIPPSCLAPEQDRR